jgi:hypothetical protein
MEVRGLDAVGNYDTTNLGALRRELDLLNEAAVQSGLIASNDNELELAVLSDYAAAESLDLGKAGARRLLAMLRRQPGDVSPVVAGTDFTEAGVVRLLAHLNKRRKRAQFGNRFLRRLLRFLARPVPMGARTSAGIGVERLQRVSRYLHKIEAYGWNQVRTAARVRRGKRQAIVSRKHLPTGIRLDALLGLETADREAP